MLSALEALNLESMSGVHTRIRCICHILNLVVKVSHPFKLDCVWDLEALTISFLGHFVTIFGETKKE